MRRINAVQLCADGRILSVWLDSTVESIRDCLGGPVDTIKLFTDCLTFVRRDTRNELPENKQIPGVYGDVLVTGGHGSYIIGLPYVKKENIIKMFKSKIGVQHGKT
ncbi:MAG: hypothetical protein J6K52_01850 [Clostridia bacterium]|nr:hypothetical protein [Clostridia bacterium]